MHFGFLHPRNNHYHFNRAFSRFRILGMPSTDYTPICPHVVLKKAHELPLPPSFSVTHWRSKTTRCGSCGKIPTLVSVNRGG